MYPQRFDSLPKHLALLSPLDAHLCSELGRKNYVDLMEMYASIEEDLFDEWYESMDPKHAEYIMELDNVARTIINTQTDKRFIN